MTIPAWEALAGEKSPDQAWLDTVALLVLDAATGPVGSAELRQLRSRIADLALAGGRWGARRASTGRCGCWSPSSTPRSNGGGRKT